MYLKKLNSYNGNHACRTGYIKKKNYGFFSTFAARLRGDSHA